MNLNQNKENQSVSRNASAHPRSFSSKLSTDLSSGCLDQKEQLHRNKEVLEKNEENACDDQYRARSMNRKLAYELGARSISRCGLGKVCRTIAPPKNGPSSSHIRVWEAKEIQVTGRTFDGEVVTSNTSLKCKSPSLCPVCAPQRAAERAEVLQPQLRKFLHPVSYFEERAEAKREKGHLYRADPGEGFDPVESHDIFLVTVTSHHQRDDDCKVLLDLQSLAWRKATDRLKKRHNRQGKRPVSYVAGLDATDSLQNGFHNHTHAVLMVPTTHEDTRGVAEDFVRAWMRACADVGLRCDRTGQDVKLVAAAPKRGVGPEQMDSLARSVRYAVTPSLISEVVGSGQKVRTKSSASITPMTHLFLAAEPNVSARDRYIHGARWQIYMSAMMGRKVVKVTRGIVLKPVRGIVPPVERLFNLPDSFANIIDKRKAWGVLDLAVKSAYAPGSLFVDQELIIQTLQQNGISLPRRDILRSIKMRLRRLPFDMPLDYVPANPIEAAPRGLELIDLTRERVANWSEYALQYGSGWDRMDVREWVDAQNERLDEQERRLRIHADDAEFEEDECVVEPW
ncbi:protein rep [Octadecabacter sp. 1_MG-2023]|uniref:protein rep n=2 Tax=unclassified Octadecabacter TaxID=196158 RepID=UPI001C085B5E|nr:protein rep [Octadecabacter sp. B2R22]MDO6735203.1 protein rep [Octadecabacter sp. 1_MG-2023]